MGTNGLTPLRDFMSLRDAMDRFFDDRCEPVAVFFSSFGENRRLALVALPEPPASAEVADERESAEDEELREPFPVLSHGDAMLPFSIVEVARLTRFVQGRGDAESPGNGGSEWHKPTWTRATRTR